MKADNLYPHAGDAQTVYLNKVITRENIEVGDYTIYNDFTDDPRHFEQNNVLYHYPINGDKLHIGRFCSIACGAKFVFNSANHTMRSLANYTFPLFGEEWNIDKREITSAWDNKGDIVVGNDVWIGYEALILAGAYRERRRDRSTRRCHARCTALYCGRRSACESVEDTF